MRETPEASLAFERYYDLHEDRTLALLAQTMHREITAQQNSQGSTKLIPTEATLLSRLKKWSTEHRWQERVIERDKAQAERERKKRAKALEAMNERHAQIGVTQQVRAIEQIKALIEAKAFGSVAAVQLLKLSTDLERVARGASTEQIAVTGKDGGPIEMKRDTEDLSEEDLQLVVGLAAQLKERKEQDGDHS